MLWGLHVWACLHSIHEWSSTRFCAKMSILSNINFLQSVYQSLECNNDDNVVAFYSDFSKAFDCVPQRLLLEKCGSIAVCGCFSEILHDYLVGREYLVRSYKRCPTGLPALAAFILHLHKRPIWLVETQRTNDLCRQPKSPFHRKSRLANSRRPEQHSAMGKDQ